MKRDDLSLYVDRLKNLFEEDNLKRLSLINDEELFFIWGKVSVEPIEYQTAFEKSLYELGKYIEWSKILNKLNWKQSARLAEIGAGYSSILPGAISLNIHRNVEYTAIDPNMEWLSLLENKIERLSFSKYFLNLAAEELPHRILPQSFDYVAGNHLINDLIENIIASKQAMNTKQSSNFRGDIVKLISEYYSNGNLVDMIEMEITKQIEGCWYSLVERGFLILNHFIFKLDIELGYPKELYYNFIDFIKPFFPKGNWVFLDGDNIGVNTKNWLIAQKIESNIN